MGLFRSDGPEGEIGKLIDNADHNSVNEARLTDLDSSGFTGRKGAKLYDQPLIDYLNEAEQPNYIFYPDNQKVEISSEAGGSSFVLDGNAIYCITDERVLVVVGRENEADASLSLPFDSIIGFECKSARMKHRISVTIESEEIIKEAISISNPESSNIQQGRYLIDLNIVNAFDSKDIDKANQFLTREILSPEGGASDSDYLTKVNNYLSAGETPQHILRGGTLEITYGSDDEYKSGKNVYTVVTDERVLVVIVQRISGNDTRSIEYHSIDGVSFEKGMLIEELQIRAGGATYEMQVLDEAEAKKAMKYIRQKMKSAQKPSLETSSDSAPDPTEQLKNIKDLHDEGILSEEEFEEKKQKLLDKI
ncbi:PH domain-containing protein [Haloarcula sp. S1AR25-5A]|uniref:PH domain-containing protein n=1 Tax=Haloarcula terrestris TaxID=2950533 RepID=A0AAE4EVR4_9EURY|nr:PH domain-containing protein [Haloarcula terrestris]MDS0221036.1 PH domain-containing protein [Haloarcula terrestris]